MNTKDLLLKKLSEEYPHNLFRIELHERNEPVTADRYSLFINDHFAMSLKDCEDVRFEVIDDRQCSDIVSSVIIFLSFI